MSRNLNTIDLSFKLLFTAYLIVLAIAYGMALLQILSTHGTADGKFGLSIKDIVYIYYGHRSGSTLESKLNGSMKNYAPNDERLEIIQWVQEGAEQRDYAPHIQEIFDRHCISCHNPSAAGNIPDFTDFKNIKMRSASDKGETYATLTRVSHIHLFGFSFIFLSIGGIFAFSGRVPRKLKYFVIAIPFVLIIIDVVSWWLTKINPRFAWIVMVSGTGLATAFAFMWLASLYEMWFTPKQYAVTQECVGRN